MLLHGFIKIPNVRLPSLLSGHKYFPSKRKCRRIGSLEFAHNEIIINYNLDKQNYYYVLPKTGENCEQYQWLQ